MIKNKKAWVAREWFIALIIFSAVIGLAYLMVGSLATDYNNDNIVDEDFKNNYDKLSDLTSDVSDIYNATNAEDGFSIIGTTEIILKSTFFTVRMMLGGLGTVASQIFSFGDDFGIPGEVWAIIAAALIAIMTISIIIIILNAINKTDKL